MSVTRSSRTEELAPDAKAVLLEVRGLSVRDGIAAAGSVWVDEVDLALARGEVLGVCGESGSGKTLTSLAMLGLLPGWPEGDGSIRYQGEELVGASRRRLRAYGAVRSPWSAGPLDESPSAPQRRYSAHRTRSLSLGVDQLRPSVAPSNS